MSAAMVSEYLTFEEFLALDRQSDLKHEYFHGQMYAMSGGTVNHGLIGLALAAAVLPSARKAGCRVHAGAVKVLIGRDYVYYPDVMVACGPRTGSDYETAPCLLAEVLSPSTRRIDLREKRGHYSTIDQLEVYLILEAELPSVEVYRRDRPSGRWTSEKYGPGESFQLTCPAVTISVDDLYEPLDL